MLLCSHGHERAGFTCVCSGNTDTNACWYLYTNTGQKTHTDTTYRVLSGKQFLKLCPLGGLRLHWFPKQCRGMLVLLFGTVTQMDGAQRICCIRERLSSLPCVEPWCKRAPGGILMLPIQFVGAKATSWMSSVDTCE